MFRDANARRGLHRTHGVLLRVGAHYVWLPLGRSGEREPSHDEISLACASHVPGERILFDETKL